MSTSHEVNEVTPSNLDQFIGQRSVVEQVRVALAAAHQDGVPFPSSLLVGPPGCGKTQTAKIIAAEMCSTFHEVLGQSIQSSADLNALLLVANHKNVVLIDECHEMERTFQTALYLALDQRRVILQGKGTRTPQSIPIAEFSLLLATTDEYKLLQPLRDRMKLVLRFNFYSAADLVELLHQRSEALKWPTIDKVFPLIAERSRGVPRLALRLLQACRRVCRAEGENRITLDHFQRACQLEQVDQFGLGPIERQYLTFLADGASRLNVIASRLGLPARTVAEVTEPFLLRIGLMVKDDAGKRELTAKGREHLSKKRSFSV